MSSPLIIEDVPAGNDLSVERDVPGVEVTDPIVLAWLTVKTRISDADPGVLQKSITATAVAGVGQIALDGSEDSGNGTASLVFQFTGAQTTSLGTLIRYFFDIQVKTASGKIFTSIEPISGKTIGRLQFRPRVTLAAS